MSNNKLDLLLILDATGGMQPHIDEVNANFMNIIYGAAASGFSPSDIRVGLVAFGDHDCGDDILLIEQSLTSKFADVHGRLQHLRTISDAGDGPEAQCEALEAATSYQMGWTKGTQENALRIAIMVTDSPPHGLSESGDSYPNGCPDQHDCVVSATRLAAQNVILHIIACEPKLSANDRAHEFYLGITQKTGGRMVALFKPAELRPIIVGLVTESADIRRLAIEHKASKLSAEVKTKRGARTRIDDAQAHTLTVDVYYEGKHATHNTKVWAEAGALNDTTKKKLKKVNIAKRFKEGSEDGKKIVLSWQQVSKGQVDVIVATATEFMKTGSSESDSDSGESGSESEDS